MTSGQIVLELQTRFGVNRIFAHRLVRDLGTKKVLELAPDILKAKPHPFVKWVGGKRQLLQQFKDMGLYPPEGFNPDKATYFEPFAGGAAFFFELLPQKSYLSDMNEELVTTYKVIRDDYKKLISLLKKYEKNNSKEFFLKIRAQKTSKLSDVQRAARFIYLNRTAFNGLYRVNQKGEFNVPYGKYNNPNIVNEENLKRVSESLQQTDIRYADYKEVLKYAKKGDFVYFDPPYYPVSRTASFTSYTKDSFLEKEQIELRDTFLKLTKKGCFVMLSNSDTQFIRDIYSGQSDKISIHTVMAGRAINSDAAKRGKVKEVVVVNY